MRFRPVRRLRLRQRSVRVLARAPGSSLNTNERCAERAAGRSREAALRAEVAFTVCAVATLLCASPSVLAQAGPPYLTNDPGTPGNANWEINLGAMPTIARGASSYQLPQIDLNFGVGDRIQLTYEIPYVLQSATGQPTQTGWSNDYYGVKWRFVDEGEGGLQVSTFPQVEMGGTGHARQAGIVGPGPRYLLPLEVSKRVGPVDLDVEAGYYLPGHGPRERILGIVAGRPVTDRLELDVEIYDDRAYGAWPHSTTMDVGGRYKLGRGFIALFMAGRSVNGLADGQPEFTGYFGLQILLSNYGRSLNTEP